MRRYLKEFSTFNSHLSTFRGFTLIELLTSLSLFAVIGAIFVSMLTFTLRGGKKTDSMENMRQNGGAALSTMVKTIRYAKYIDIPACTNARVNQMIVTPIVGSPTTISCGSGSNALTVDGVSLIDTTDIAVQNCSFTCRHATSVDAPTITIQFTLASKGTSGLFENNVSIPFQTSVGARNATIASAVLIPTFAPLTPTATPFPTIVLATATPTPLPTSVVPTSTPIPTAIPPTPTRTPTPIPPTPTRTPTPVPPTPTPVPPADIIIDNTVASVVGTWTTGTGSTDKYGSDYRYRSAGSGSNYVRYTPNITRAGYYNVYEWHPAGANRPTNAQHVVTHNGTTNTVTVNQETNGGRWNLLGRFYFATGTGGNVRITDVFSGDASTVGMADAIKFVWSP